MRAILNHHDTRTPGESPREPSEAVDRIAYEIVDAAYPIHEELGPGLLESVHEVCLEHELKKRSLAVSRQVGLPFICDEVEIEAGYPLDLVAEDKVIVELKSVDSLLQIHLAQVLTHLKLGGFKLGLLINFNVPKIKDGLRRIVL